jgi:hypothetical protein
MGKNACVYSVVRYVPDPVKNEPTNLGVILQCLDVGYVNCRFTSNLHRKLGVLATDADTKILQAYVDEFYEAFKPFSCYPSTVSMFKTGSEFLESDYLDRLAERGQGKIQFTVPQGSLVDNPEKELDYLFTTYVGGEAPALEKQAIRSRLKTEVKREFQRRKILAPRSEKEKRGFVEDSKIAGGKTSIDHLIDFSYTNGRVYLVEAVDMRNKAEQSWISKTYEAAFKFDDLKQGENGKIIEPYSIVAIPNNGYPSDSVKILETYSTVFRFTKDDERKQFFWEMEKIIKGDSLF